MKYLQQSKGFYKNLLSIAISTALVLGTSFTASAAEQVIDSKLPL